MEKPCYLHHRKKNLLNRLKQLLFLLVPALLFSCNKDRNYNYSIKDFRTILQPHLVKIVSKGIVMYYDSSLRNMATNRELLQLSQSELPVLRASALHEMLRRKTFNQFDVLSSHLDDTATVRVAEGEFGIYNKTVSDYMLEETKWETLAEKNKIIEEVVTKHNYLKSAYTIVSKIDPQEKFVNARDRSGLLI